MTQCHRNCFKALLPPFGPTCFEHATISSMKTIQRSVCLCLSFHLAPSLQVSQLKGIINKNKKRLNILWSIMQNPPQSNKDNQLFQTSFSAKPRQINQHRGYHMFWLKQYLPYLQTVLWDPTNWFHISLNPKQFSKKCTIFASFESSRITVCAS